MNYTTSHARYGLTAIIVFVTVAAVVIIAVLFFVWAQAETSGIFLEEEIIWETEGAETRPTSSGGPGTCRIGRLLF